MASVEDGTGQDADQEEEETLKSADPGDGGCGLVREQGGLIVFLIDAEGVDDAPSSRIRRSVSTARGAGRYLSLRFDAPRIEEEEVSPEDLDVCV